MWYPGELGGPAIADTLFGDYNPSGRLPLTFYAANYVNQIEMSEMSMSKYPGRTYRYLQVDPIFHFGHGLSYTTFGLEWNNEISPKSSTKENHRSVSVSVSNTGKFAGNF